VDQADGAQQLRHGDLQGADGLLRRRALREHGHEPAVDERLHDDRPRAEGDSAAPAEHVVARRRDV
jgi:hypothetical protein